MKIWIKGKMYTVERKDDLADEGAVGCILKKEKIIYISKKAVFLDETILHELIHGFLFECGLADICEDESLVGWFSFQLLQIFECFKSIKSSELYRELKE